MLAELAQKQIRITHANLDAYPPSKFGHHLRRALVNAGALPDRDEPLERIDRWLDDILLGGLQNGQNSSDPSRGGSSSDGLASDPAASPLPRQPPRGPASACGPHWTCSHGWTPVTPGS
jgi:hypothetical protein